MSTDAYIALAWIVTFGGVGGYAGWVIRRGRALSRQVAPDRRRWM